MQNDAKPILSVRNLKTSFFTDEGVVRAVDGASFDVHLGQTLGIVGESGCGKSVTALSILGIVPRPGRIVEGEILLRRESENGQAHEIALTSLGDSSREMRSIRGAEIALVFQEPMTSLSPVHTIGNQIMGAARLHRKLTRQEASELAVELLSLVGIPRAEGAIDAYPFQLSGGLRQRALIALALSCEPRLLIADEPTTALDVTTQAQILDLLRSLQEQNGMAIMLITHDMGVIAEMADQVRGDVPGPRGGGRPRRHGLWRIEAPLYAVAAALDPQHPLDAQGAASNDHRHDPPSLQPARGLPFPSPLPGRH